MTLVQLAEATGLSHPFISQLERGLAQPSLSSLRRIAAALETSPIGLIAAADTSDPLLAAVEVHLGGERCVSTDLDSGATRMLATGERPLNPIEVDSHNAEPGDFFRHDGDEFVYVVEGDVSVELRDAELQAAVQRLTAGDSAYYRAGVSHRWWSATGAPYRLVIVKQNSPGSSA